MFFGCVCSKCAIRPTTRLTDQKLSLSRWNAVLSFTLSLSLSHTPKMSPFFVCILYVNWFCFVPNCSLYSGLFRFEFFHLSHQSFGWLGRCNHCGSLLKIAHLHKRGERANTAWFESLLST